VSERLTVDKQTLYSYDLTDGSEPFFNLGALGLSEQPELGKGQSVILYMSKERRFDPDSPVGVVLHFAYHSLYFMAMWMKDVHIGMIEDGDDIEQYIVDNGLVGEFNTFLNEICSMDIALSGRDGRLFVVKEMGEFPFRTCASRGMMVMCRLYCWVRRCRDRESLIYFDDFDDMFHYRTAEKAIKWIISGSKAQCIFVTHNTGLASNDFLRPDCCFLMDGGRLSSFSSLTDKDIRRGHNLEKMLREGEFDRSVD